MSEELGNYEGGPEEDVSHFEHICSSSLNISAMCNIGNTPKVFSGMMNCLVILLNEYEYLCTFGVCMF